MIELFQVQGHDGETHWFQSVRAGLWFWIRDRILSAYSRALRRLRVATDGDAAKAAPTRDTDRAFLRSLLIRALTAARPAPAPWPVAWVPPRPVLAAGGQTDLFAPLD